MAIVNYTVTGTSKDSWSGSITVASYSNQVTSDIPSFITIVSPLSFSFSPVQLQSYPSPSDSAYYVTWRNNSFPTQYPNTGYSFDVWSKPLYDAIVGGATWSTLVGSTYTLNSNKHTLIYNYDAPGAVVWGNGGSITFSS